MCRICAVDVNTFGAGIATAADHRGRERGKGVQQTL